MWCPLVTPKSTTENGTGLGTRLLQDTLLGTTPLALFPGARKLGRRAPGIHCLCIHGSPGFVGNLETTAILVRVAQPYITETQESFTSTRHSSVQPSSAICPR